MSSKKPKFYVVWKGKAPGIYRTWAECEAQVKGFPEAKYKSFQSEGEARDALQNYPEGMPVSLKKRRTSVKAGNWNPDSIAVDAACSGNPGVMEYRGVLTDSGEEIFHSPIFPTGTNNIGEFLAIVHALALLKEKAPKKMIYSDSRTAIAWVEKGKAKTTLPRTGETEELWKLIERAERWLEANAWNNPLVKWQTEKWGEIPADFGRKG